jgi:2-haloacid dehalogenase
MLEAAKPHIGFTFERMISVAVAGAFKPHVVTYRTAAEIVGLAPHEILFVANHAFDCVGAKAFGMATCFVNRRQRPFGDWPYQPDLVVSHFTELAEKLT